LLTYESFWLFLILAHYRKIWQMCVCIDNHWTWF
jgi:hypothetical protein